MAEGMDQGRFSLEEKEKKGRETKGKGSGKAALSE